MDRTAPTIMDSRAFDRAINSTSGWFNTPPPIHYEKPKSFAVFNDSGVRSDPFDTEQSWAQKQLIGLKLEKKRIEVDLLREELEKRKQMNKMLETMRLELMREISVGLKDPEHIKSELVADITESLVKRFAPSEPKRKKAKRTKATKKKEEEKKDEKEEEKTEETEVQQVQKPLTFVLGNE